MLLLLTIGLVSSRTLCPDGTECQERNTCCPTKTGYACCHYPSAVCCSDKAHCCPQGYRCDLNSRLCEKQEVPWYRLLPSPQIPAQENSVPAPLEESNDPAVSVVHCDNYYTCPDGTTCCRTPYGQWNCCKYNVGQCCRDGIHCCPFGYRCDNTSTQCFRGALRFPAAPRIPAMKSDSMQIPAQEEENRVPAPLEESNDPAVSVVFCDNYYTCPDGTTCCRTPYGQWTCCIYNVGQCCRDGIHCCPFGYRCDSTSTQCFRGALRFPAAPRIPAMKSDSMQIPAQEEENRVPAPLEESNDSAVSVVFCDNYYTCPDGTTCCRTPYGQWTCCIYNVGQCCRDGIHCCPFGYRCDSTSTQCFRGALRFPAAPRIPAMKRDSMQIPTQEEENRVPAPLEESNDPAVSVVFCDNYYTCPDGTTCCRTPYGQWTCCIYNVGQCCRDGIHCCPFGYRCDSTSTQCFRGALRFPAAPRIPAMKSDSMQIPAQKEENRVPAPLEESNDPAVSVVFCDNYYTCPDGTTCCRTPYGQWTCCIYNVGQCCPDGIHCCPFGFRCDSTSTQCFRGALRFPAAPRIPAMKRDSMQDHCCQSEKGCCPIGFRCDEASKACISDFDIL
ncbi:granulin-a isoform X7 [Silurus asotus]|uniref:Granulin-a isoform X7 n=1 Tax=Silurus asotus TaxID=30991 RepID=A0AAD5AU80_SILAS|nr:granulin-a isoform X7 [Silurus asotus]